ncbi:Uu.00g068180.m01.CDS01 [Anthostomella pinea]|uniref:Uu.00g068180.m01.CDS01 n=1 Tax=Anthostomella pinea TaxID=933095 RepID=A0AAI8YNF0_9PEZI|nr:Uu.00g068180.m01.CDS01 [Anthostomella pinea]
MSRPANLFTALIRTHHITSRKKIQRVKKAASHHALPFVLIRSGGSPGIMYAESADEAGVSGWVAAVQGLRYKDFQCAQKPAASDVNVPPQASDSGFVEVTSVAEFGERMQQRGLGSWWKSGMGYESSD